MLNKKLYWISVFIIIIIFIIIKNYVRTESFDYPLYVVPLSDIKLNDKFWSKKLETNRTVTIPHAFEKCEKTGRIDNFAIAGGLKKSFYNGQLPFLPFDDSDVYKIIEAASYTLQTKYDPQLENYLDRIISKIAAAQEEDGYIFTGRTINPDNPTRWAGISRWSNLRYSHELYNCGHLYEAAVAHYEATGKRELFEVATKNADLLVKVFGADKKRDVSGHEEVEVGLIRLYRATGNHAYLKLAEFFINERGNYTGRESYKDFRQDHLPVIEQKTAVGHAVSGTYLYMAMADMAVPTKNYKYIEALNEIWNNMVFKQMYITGSSAAKGERFSDDYVLPNLKGYNETCAAIASILWNFRLFRLHGHTKYIDILERILFNGFLSGISLQGDKFFYSNPLSSDGVYKFNGVDIPDKDKTASRMDWFVCACCPSNVTRLIPQIPGFIYAFSNDTIYINLFMANETNIKMENNSVRLQQLTDYPWDGLVEIIVEPEKEKEFFIFLRIPGWANNKPIPSDLFRYVKQDKKKVTIKVNDEKYPVDMHNGFAKIFRSWKKGDTIQLNLPMSVRRVVSNQKIENNRGKIALEHGPIVYCFEWPDNRGHVYNLVLPDHVELNAGFNEELLGGIGVIRGKVAVLDKNEKSVEHMQELTAIPYYAWAHRGEGEMLVWIPRL
jgi:DUF1680 family protein